jgi:hypothetical protein
MKAIKLTGFILFITLSAARLMAQNQIHVKLTNPAKSYKLNVELTLGSIKVSAYQGREIIIEADVPSDQQKNQTEAPKGMKQLSKPQNLAVIAQENNNEVTVNDNSGKLVNLTIKLPTNAASIKIKTVRGDIMVSNVGAALEIQNTVGSINALNISGSLVANTTRGKVLVSFKSIDSKAAMAFSSLVGDIDVTFPANLKANLKIQSELGQLYSDFDVADDPSRPKAKINAKDGKYQLTNDDWIYGKVAGGGPEMLLKNSRGNIYIRKAK